MLRRLPPICQNVKSYSSIGDISCTCSPRAARKMAFVWRQISATCTESGRMQTNIQLAHQNAIIFMCCGSQCEARSAVLAAPTLTMRICCLQCVFLGVRVLVDGFRPSVLALWHQFVEAFSRPCGVCESPCIRCGLGGGPLRRRLAARPCCR